MPDLTGNAQYDAITTAIKGFSFWNYGLDETDPNDQYAEWVPDLADAINAAINEAVIDAQGAPHHGCCPDHDWRGPGRDTAAQACADLGQHEAEAHGKEADHA
jgi:hypothetical protein